MWATGSAQVACVQRTVVCLAGAQLMQRSKVPGSVIYVAGMFPGTTPDDYYDGARAGTDVACRRCGDTSADRPDVAV